MSRTEVGEAGRIKLWDKQPRPVDDFAGLKIEPNFRRIRGRVRFFLFPIFFYVETDD